MSSSVVSVRPLADLPALCVSTEYEICLNTNSSLSLQEKTEIEGTLFVYAR